MEEKDAIVAERIMRGLRDRGIPEPFPGMFSVVIKGEDVTREFIDELDSLDQTLDHRERAIELLRRLNECRGVSIYQRMISVRLARATRLWFAQVKNDLLACRVENCYAGAAEIINYAPFEVQRDVILWVAKCLVEPIIEPEPCSDCRQVMRWDFDQKKLRCLSCERKRVVALPVNDGPPCHECSRLMGYDGAISRYRCSNCGAISV